MDISQPFLIDSVTVIDASKWSESRIKSEAKSFAKNKTSGELYLITTFPIESSLETFPEGQVLNITIQSISECSQEDIESLLKALGNLRDYYPDLTVRVIDLTEKINAVGLPKDTIIKKTGAFNAPVFN